MRTGLRSFSTVMFERKPAARTGRRLKAKGVGLKLDVEQLEDRRTMCSDVSQVALTDFGIWAGVEAAAAEVAPSDESVSSDSQSPAVNAEIAESGEGEGENQAPVITSLDANLVNGTWVISGTITDDDPTDWSTIDLSGVIEAYAILVNADGTFTYDSELSAVEEGEVTAFANDYWGAWSNPVTVSLS